MKDLSIKLTINIVRYNVDITLLPFRWNAFSWMGIYRLGPVEIFFDYACFYDIFSVGIAVDA